VVKDADGKVVFQCDTLEKPWKDNVRRESCIPTGAYEAVAHVSTHFGRCLWVTHVPGRDQILIHPGNYQEDTLGCILVGYGYTDLNGDGHKDLVNSRAAMRDLLAAVPGDMHLTVVSA